MASNFKMEPGYSIRVRRIGKWGKSGRTRGRRNHDQNIMNGKKPFSILKNAKMHICNPRTPTAKWEDKMRE